jgi:hypothetical protein
MSVSAGKTDHVTPLLLLGMRCTKLREYRIAFAAHVITVTIWLMESPL